ncbi:hypothetical protein NKR23_g4087 [Pleurostoma richardsiae]|uniref:Zn(2)-C6 fungal-type domain-containing protein n=1 Tax=Pleurostoma richardsiae TaxID=41990 RepID=A0AA38S3E9_9PEZI|nr:hypothetical protein NKR23_g4087 [Pleurostoma richardsiae]
MPETSSKRARAEDDGGSQPARCKRKTVRKRAALACEECRVRKRRCDGAIPACGGCARRMSACVYSSEIEARAWHTSMIQSLRNRLEELEAAEFSMQTLEMHAVNSRSLDSAAGPEWNGQTPSSTSVPVGEIGGNGNVATVVGHASSPASTAAASPIADPGPSQDHEATTSSADAAAYSQMVTAPEGVPAGCLEPRNLERLMKPIHRAIDGKGDATNRATLLQPGLPAPPGPGAAHDSGASCTCDRSLDATRWCLPLRRVADGLVAAYFSRVHRMYPILHERTFQGQYEQLWETGASAAAARPLKCSGLCRQKSRGKLFPAMLHAVFSLAALFDSGRLKENATRADAFFREAQGLDLLGVLDDEMSIELIQLGLLLGFYLQATERFSKCWNITGLTIRLAQNMGLHLDLAEARRRGFTAPSPTQLECEMRTRVWHGEVSMSFGRSLMVITTSEKRLRLPEAIDDSRLSDEAGKWNAQPGNLPSLLESFIQTIKLYDILGQVLDGEDSRETIPVKNSAATSLSGATSSIRTLLDFDAMVMEWRESLPRYLWYGANSAESSEAEVAAPEGLAVPRADLLVQAKRLYLRFLHVRLLILRPALEMLFEKQRNNRISPRESSGEVRLEDLVLRNIAAQCVLSAQELIRFLDGEIRSQDCLAWWYNVSYLQSCASTILLGQLCNLGDGSISDESLSASWELCLQCLSRYTELSSISRKSIRLLQESARRLLPGSHGQKNRNHTLANKKRLPGVSGQDGTLPKGHSAPEQVLEPTIAMDGSLLEGEISSQLPSERIGQQTMNYISEADLDMGTLDGLDGGLETMDTSGVPHWTFMPFISQLEALPLSFDASNPAG